MKALRLQKLRDLVLDAASAPGRAPQISAASGLVATSGQIYVVADEELHLAVFERAGNAPGQLVRLFDGTLPGGKHRRKERKPDLEILALAPAMPSFPHGALLAFGSGSTERRRRAVAIGLNKSGAVSGTPRQIDLTRLYGELALSVTELNLEGATIGPDELRLFQRGNRTDPRNAVMRLPMSTLAAALDQGRFNAANARIDWIPLGTADGIPMTITDAALLPDGQTLVTLVAEDTMDAYADGDVVGAGIALLDDDFRLVAQWSFDPIVKVEGISAVCRDGGIDLLAVTDADDERKAASLYTARIAL